MVDAFDHWWEWAKKPLDSDLTIPASIHNPVMGLSDDHRHNRTKVNAAVAYYKTRNEKVPSRQ
jgi:hypothetical protein